ncbi:molybdenum cofactor guanylyltransferase [Chryseolinea sp. H1M3-3]|uniref:molybdenum cofactor guanylyltransferase n=1 Tax=Chryseolinea sp. H1M3-3 TaxID=3034144 RepID=UPI0023ED0E6E|nr:molybdenum cofactor guanylyltransferase [Chryseolinea sp. H1M3-3]
MKHTTARTLNGLILAGGKSLRMGQDKSLIEYHNVSQREYLFAVLKNFCAAVFTSCKITQTVPARFNPLPDKFDFESPLNGILTAFAHDSIAAWLTVPVDMPLIDVEVISYLISRRDTSKVATCFYDSDGKNPEPLIAIWEPRAHSLLSNFYKEGKISPRDFLKQYNTHIIQIPDRNALANINSPEELEKFKANFKNE